MICVDRHIKVLKEDPPACHVDSIHYTVALRGLKRVLWRGGKLEFCIERTSLMFGRRGIINVLYRDDTPECCVERIHKIGILRG